MTMPLDFDITASVKEQSAIPFERLTLVRRFDELPLAQIRRGIVYFLAGWSGLSLIYFYRLTKALTPFVGTSLEIYVVEIDCVPAEFMMSTFGHSHPAGSGETIWVRDGRVVSVVDAYDGPQVDSEVLLRTRELLDGDVS
jgi:hypothetical protein